MSLLSRIRNVFRKDKLQREIDEELADHLDSAIADGRKREEAELALGNRLRHRESSTDIKLAAWLDSLRADTVFGLRQLRRRPTVTAAAIISLALAIGAVTSAFRLIDATLLRPLPVADPHSLFVLGYSYVDDSGKSEDADSFSYPLFREFRDAVKDKADVMVVDYASRLDITYASDNEMEKAYRQSVSGNHFGVFGLQPALGRLLTAADDQKPGAHPVAVLSYDYWTRRFGRDPKAVGRTFREGTHLYEIIGVVQEGYTGTETGTMTDFFIPAMQNTEAINEAGWQWMRIWVRPKPGVTLAQIQQPLQASMIAHRRERTKSWPADTPKQRLEGFLNTTVMLNSAAAGVSGTQKNYRQPLLILGVVVLLVLLIACANVANLLTAQAAAREKEMALRVSIGAGRARLVQMMLVECLLLALAATAIGALFAWWSAPMVVGMINPRDNPLRLSLPADWRVLGFAAAVAFCVTILFGLAPALRASGIKPMSALKGGDDPHSRRRLMNALVAAQVAFCVIVHFVAGLFVATFERLSTQPTGFATERILLLQTNVRGEGNAARRPQNVWAEIADRIRNSPGVEAASFATWPLMGGSSWSSDVRFPNRQPDTVAPYFLGVSPGWLNAMGIQLLTGRDFRPGELPSRIDERKKPIEGPAIVNEAFAKKYFDGQNPVNGFFEKSGGDKLHVRNRIVGYVRDARYRNMREAIRPTVYVPFEERSSGTFIVRTTAADPTSIARPLRQLVSDGRPEFLVSNVRTQSELVRNQTIRERLLATLSVFFAIVALVLAAVGLYGVLNYAVLQRRREIGIRMALGARTSHVARHISADVFLMLILGSGIGLAAGLASERFVASLLFEVKGTDVRLLATPLLTLFAAAFLAALPPIIAATRTDPSTALRSE
jgi:predicted permease